MTLVMDGVRRSAGARLGGVDLAVPALRTASRPVMRPISAATSRANSGVRYVTGMDGVRRPVRMTPREIVRNSLEAESVAAVMSMPQPAIWQRLTWHLPQLEWKRSAIAFGLVAMALVVSGVTVRALATPRAVTARAESAPATQSTPPTPAVSAAPAAAAPKKTGLQTLLNDFMAANGSQFGIVVKDMKSGETASINPDRQIMSASLYKLFVAQRIYQRIDLGQLGYGDAAGGGTGRNIDGCLTVMINVSDNGCGRALGQILGWGKQNEALRVEGYNQTNLATPQQTSAQDVAKLFTRLYEGTLLSPSSTQRFTDLLKGQRVNNRLPVGLPKGTVFAHKTGDLDGVVHDAGIVYGPKTDYLVVVTSGPWATPGTAPAKFANLSLQLWNYFEQ